MPAVPHHRHPPQSFSTVTVSWCKPHILHKTHASQLYDTYILSQWQSARVHHHLSAFSHVYKQHESHIGSNSRNHRANTHSGQLNRITHAKLTWSVCTTNFKADNVVSDMGTPQCSAIPCSLYNTWMSRVQSLATTENHLRLVIPQLTQFSTDSQIRCIFRDNLFYMNRRVGRKLNRPIKSTKWLCVCIYVKDYFFVKTRKYRMFDEVGAIWLELNEGDQRSRLISCI